MKVEQIYTSCLAQGAYYIESNGEAAVIDPLREVGDYIDMAAERGAKIKYVFETHFHADFVSGHLTLAKHTGATIVFGPTAKTDFDCLVAEDNQEFKVGNITIKLLHTPGHTMESSSYLLLDENGKEIALFSGDTLFLGDVGRPDLAQKSNLTEKDLAGILFDSLRTKIMPLADEVIVYPGHGAGSACGKKMSTETVGTIGHEKSTNYALRSDMTKQEFIKEVTEGMLPPPAYFPENVRLNKQGYNPENDNITKANIALSVTDFKRISKQENAVILDVRHQKDFVKGYIPNSIFIGVDGGFAPWVGTIIKQVETPILLVCDKDRLEEVATRLSRVGFDSILGHLNGGIESWNQDDLATISSISADVLNTIYQADNTIDIVDVRKEFEYKNRHIVSAVLNPLSNLKNDKLNAFAENYVHCAGGYRSVIACSLLKREGIQNVTNIEGGFGAIKNTNIHLSDEVCPSTL
ncbi:MAG: MBL fold metallo-hydrolase [Flavobacteriales bacterium]|jgi:glyoxylase-like metal-dependent hydrolase (beta-lactamase superfamily II)/rhodanese-related sulfurtransferase|nr:MBL fold metallo-hydrolase [Flavobacteriales bacterium]